MAAVEVGEMSTYPRYDLQHVADPSERPASTEYDRYLWLVKSLRGAGATREHLPPQHVPGKDVLFSAILVAANEALLEIAEVVEASDEERELVEGWAGRGRKGLEKCWDEKLNLCLDHDLRADKPLRARTVAGFAAPLIAGRQSPERLGALLGELDSTAFAGHPELRWPLPPSTSPKERGFHPRSYCRPDMAGV